MATSPLSSTITEAEHGRQLRRAVLASTIGTAIEWYDFFLYSTVTGLVFAQLYFPRADPLVGTVEAFGRLESMQWVLSPGQSGRQYSDTTAIVWGERPH